MSHEQILEDPLVTLDDLIIGGRKIYQRLDQFKFSIDAVLLAHFASYKKGASYLDLGTGTGILPLLATALGADHVTGLEINPIMAGLARQSVAYNGLEESIQIIEGDYRLGHLGPSAKEGLLHLGSRPFAGVLVNPPYYDSQAGKKPASHDLSLALHDRETSLDMVLATAKRLVKYGGKLWMIYLASRLPHALGTMSRYGFAPKRMRLVHSYPKGQAKLVLLEGQLGAKEGLVIEDPLFIYKGPGVYTEEVAGWYGQANRNPLPSADTHW